VGLGSERPMAPSVMVPAGEPFIDINMLAAPDRTSCWGCLACQWPGNACSMPLSGTACCSVMAMPMHSGCHKEVSGACLVVEQRARAVACLVGVRLRTACRQAGVFNCMETAWKTVTPLEWQGATLFTATWHGGSPCQRAAQRGGAAGQCWDRRLAILHVSKVGNSPICTAWV